MSVSLWAWNESCDNSECCGECDLCKHLPENDEMTQFRILLNNNGIEWHDNSSFMPSKELSKYDIERTHFMYNGYKWSVIHGYGTYGGYDFIKDNDDGLLEIMSEAINDGEPIGWLTAEDALTYVKESEPANENNGEE